MKRLKSVFWCLATGAVMDSSGEVVAMTTLEEILSLPLQAIDFYRFTVLIILL